MVTVDRWVRVLATDERRQSEHDTAVPVAAVGEGWSAGSVDLCLWSLSADGVVQLLRPADLRDLPKLRPVDDQGACVFAKRQFEIFHAMQHFSSPKPRTNCSHCL